MGAILNKVETKQATLLVLSTSFSGGGAEKVARLMVEQLEGSTCILFENEAGIKIDGSDVCVMWSRRFTRTIATLFLNGFRFLYIQIKKLRLHPDTTISHLEGPNFLNLLTVGGGKRVIVVHNVIAENYAEKSFLDSCKLVLINRLYKRADVVVGVSRDVCNELVQNFEVEEDRVVFVPNAVDISAINKASMSSFFDNRDRVLSDNYVINVASLTPQKNQLFLLRVFKEFRKWSRNHNGLKLVVIGDGEQKQALIEYCREIDLEAQEIEDGHYPSSSKVLFLGYQENPYPFMRNAKILLLTSLWEGLPLVLLESMALGIPVVVSNCSSGVRDLLEVGSNENGSDVKNNNTVWTKYGAVIEPFIKDQCFHQQWVEAVDTLLTEGQFYETCSIQCKRRAKDFDINNVTHLWKEIISRT
jgi:glycosyltransferase involved in cell wall biosynthesis